ncbi:BCCT family transporter [Desulfospira joergensenii]|uniref:BCCT family transporter n=1 Tax=Desulfospira joergensenii TaxID=53329 RepID=UPI0003F6A114|nr:BCCT family transporter [Desulfospira joergensenii]
MSTLVQDNVDFAAARSSQNGFLGKYDVSLFWGTLILCSGITLWGIIWPDGFSKAMSGSQSWISLNFGWFFMLTVSVFIIFLAWAGMSRYGAIPLGQDGEAPEFSFSSWIAMLFSCGIGIGFIFWGVAEPLYHYMSPPYMATGATPDAAPVAMQISLLHWGIHGWVCYAVAGLAIAYTTYRLKMPLSVANSLVGILGDKTGSLWGKLVDFLAAFATIAGISTSLGMGLMSIRFGINHVFGAQLGTPGLVVVMLFLIAGYTLSAVSGLNKGIKILSNINMILAFGVLLFFLFAGPTRFLLNLMVDSVGAYLSNIVFMSFWTDPMAQASDGKWMGWWTIFYWCWWIAWGPFVGGFVARISRGRTIAEFVFGTILVPLVITIVWFNVIGGSALYAEMHGILEMYKAISADAGSGIFTLLTQYPLGSLVSFVVFFNLIIFLVTSADSASFFVAMIISGGELEPSTPIKLIFGGLIGSITVVLLITGGLKALQTASIVAALPFAFVMLGMVASMLVLLKKEKVK